MNATESSIAPKQKIPFKLKSKFSLIDAIYLKSVENLASIGSGGGAPEEKVIKFDSHQKLAKERERRFF